MKVRNFEKSIFTAFNSMLDMDVTDWSKFSRKGSLAPDSGFNKIALNSLSSYEETYKAALSLNYFNFALNDHSFFQFSLRHSGDGFQLRYAYYPNPFYLDEESRLLITEALIDQPNYIDQLLDETPIFIDKPPIRYDYDPHGHCPCEHPAGHLHVGAHASSRWPVRKVLAPDTFCFFIAKQYYSIDWNKYGFQKEASGGFNNPLDHRYAVSASNCESLADELFTKEEADHLFIN